MKKTSVCLFILLVISASIFAGGVLSATSGIITSAATYGKSAWNTVKNTVEDTSNKLHSSYVEWKDPYLAFTKIEIGPTDENSKSSFTYNIPVGKDFLIYLEIAIVNNGILKTDKRIDVQVTLPLTNISEVVLDAGLSKNDVKYDKVKGTQTYTFRVRSGDKDEGKKYQIRFRCTPLTAGTSTISVKYDDNVSETWDTFTTLQYVK